VTQEISGKTAELVFLASPEQAA